MERSNKEAGADDRTKQGTESNKRSRRWRPIFEIDIVVFSHRIRLQPNVHAILAFSALFVAGALIYSEILAHGEATPLHIAEVAHFAGWVYLELPEALAIEALGQEELEKYWL